MITSQLRLDQLQHFRARLHGEFQLGMKCQPVLAMSHPCGQSPIEN